MSGRTLIRLVWLLFILGILTAIGFPMVLQDARADREQVATEEIHVPFTVDRSTGMATLRLSDLIKIARINAALAAELERRRSSSGCT